MTEKSVSEQPFLMHLLELRDRLMRMLLVILIFFLILFPFGNDIYTFIAQPLMDTMPEGSTMIATQVASPFLTPFKLSLVASVFCAMPFILYQLWAFIAPGLYQNEKKMAIPLLISSILLFYLGGVFAYFVVFPLVFSFLTGVVPDGVAVMTDITHYLDFVLMLFFAFGAAFEVPIATILLVWMGATTPQKLRDKRPYVIVGAFVLGMFLTPPDVISQTLLAFPMWILFEIGIIFSGHFVRKKDEDLDDDMESRTIMPAEKNTGESVAIHEDNDYVVPTDEELEAELDQMDDDDDDDEEDGEEKDETIEVDNKQALEEETEIESQKTADEDALSPHAKVDKKLEKVMELRENMDITKARTILYEILVEGDESQIRVAKNILAQLDLSY